MIEGGRIVPAPLHRGLHIQRARIAEIVELPLPLLERKVGIAVFGQHGKGGLRAGGIGGDLLLVFRKNGIHGLDAGTVLPLRKEIGKLPERKPRKGEDRPREQDDEKDMDDLKDLFLHGPTSGRFCRLSRMDRNIITHRPTIFKFFADKTAHSPPLAFLSSAPPQNRLTAAPRP